MAGLRVTQLLLSNSDKVRHLARQQQTLHFPAGALCCVVAGTHVREGCGAGRRTDCSLFQVLFVGTTEGSVQTYMWGADTTAESASVKEGQQYLISVGGVTRIGTTTDETQVGFLPRPHIFTHMFHVECREWRLTGLLVCSCLSRARMGRSLCLTFTSWRTERCQTRRCLPPTPHPQPRWTSSSASVPGLRCQIRATATTQSEKLDAESHAVGRSRTRRNSST